MCVLYLCVCVSVCVCALRSPHLQHQGCVVHRLHELAAVEHRQRHVAGQRADERREGRVVPLGPLPQQPRGQHREGRPAAAVLRERVGQQGWLQGSDAV